MNAKYFEGQIVHFATREGSDEGLSGVGRITEVQDGDNINKYIVEHTYKIEAGPYAGEVMTSNIMVIESEMTPVEDKPVKFYSKPVDPPANIQEGLTNFLQMIINDIEAGYNREALLKAVNLKNDVGIIYQITEAE